MTSSISRQLVWWLAVPLMLLALCGALIHYFNAVAPGVISSDRRLKDASNALMAHAALPPGASIIYAIRDSHGRLLLGDERLPAVALNDDTTQLFALSRFDRQNVRTLTSRFDTPGGVILITVADLRAGTEPAARYGLMSTLLWDFVQLDVTLVLVWIGIRFGLRPVQRLREEIAARSPLDLRAIELGSVPREISPVVVTLNRLFGMLRTSAQSQQQFIANTAHQLRTPITGMQAQLDLLIAEPAAKPVETRLLTLQESVRQLAHSANQLLALARADRSVNLATRLHAVDLKVIISDVVARFFDRALQLGIDLGVELQETSVQAEASLLDDLLSNLVDNALKYTPPGGRVTVSAGQQFGRPYLAVEDTGAGIPETERQRVRQRFYRLPNSRGHGSGLGLAIVDEIAQLFNARFDITSGANGIGTRIELHFAEARPVTWVPD